MSSPSAPRPSASLIIVNAKNEVLMVHRNPKATSFAGVHVFPGGNYDSAQDASLEMTAIRETFEESGVLLASSSLAMAQPELNKYKEDIHAQRLGFQEFLTQQNLEIAIDQLLPFTEWVTPPTIPKRFRTQFFVTFLPEIQRSRDELFSSGDKRDYLPTPDGGQEVIEARFIRPSTALSEFASKRIQLMPPQYYLLHTLADILQHPSRVQTSERTRVEALARGAFGHMSLNPRGLKDAELNMQGVSVMTYEGDESRGGREGNRHRALIKWDERGKVPDEITLVRNLDIFSDAAIPSHAQQSKL